jgi:hypothetical protein
MTGHDSEPGSEQITSWLAACDEALAAGNSLAGSADVPPNCRGGWSVAWPA